MKILHVIANLSPEKGGPPKAALEMCRALTRDGHVVTLYTTNADGDNTLAVPTDRPVMVSGVKVSYFPIGHFRRWSFSLLLGFALREQVKEFDIVHIHSLYLFHTFAAAYYCRRYGVPYLIRPHGTLDPFLRRKSRFKKAIYNFLIEKRDLDGSAAVHYTTQEEMALAHDALRIRAPGVVVPLGIDLEDYSDLPQGGALRSHYPEIEEKRIILFLGRLNFKKGLDILARAFGILARQRSDIHLVIAGPDRNGYGTQVRKWLAQEKVLDKVTFTGMLAGQDKLSAFADADVFVLPSYTENFGMAVVEAMACSLPVVISNKVNIWREIDEAQAGIVIECQVGELVEALHKVLDEPASRKEWGENGRQLVEQEFTWDRVAEQMVKAYESVLDSDLGPRHEQEV